jgi:putative oxidoreductase
MKHDDPMRDLALLAARSVLGAGIAAHGAQKLLGWFGGPGVQGAAPFFEQLGFRPGEQHVRLAAYVEIVAGGLIAAGALGPVGPAMLASDMVVAGISNHLKNGFFAQNSGVELNVAYAAGALFLAAGDYGRLSFDAIAGLRERFSSRFAMLAFGAGIAGGAYMLSRRSLEPPQEPPVGTPRVETGTIGEPAQRYAPPNP